MYFSLIDKFELEIPTIVQAPHTALQYLVKELFNINNLKTLFLPKNDFLVQIFGRALPAFDRLEIEGIDAIKYFPV